MAITVPAARDCQECRGRGRTIDPVGFTHACQTCWRGIVAKKMRRVEVFADPPKERLRHAAGHVVGNARDRRDRTVTILNWFEREHSNGRFTDRQHAAAEKFRTHYFRGQMAGALSSVDWNSSPSRGEGRSFINDGNEVHRIEFTKARDQVGLDTCRVLVMTVCNGDSFQEAGRLLGWRDRKQSSAAAIQVTRLGLDRLAGLWRL